MTRIISYRELRCVDVRLSRPIHTPGTGVVEFETTLLANRLQGEVVVRWQEGSPGNSRTVRVVDVDPEEKAVVILSQVLVTVYLAIDVDNHFRTDHVRRGLLPNVLSVPMKRNSSFYIRGNLEMNLRRPGYASEP
jgi:hypothetical protein